MMYFTVEDALPRAFQLARYAVRREPDLHRRSAAGPGQRSGRAMPCLSRPGARPRGRRRRCRRPSRGRRAPSRSGSERSRRSRPPPAAWRGAGTAAGAGHQHRRVGWGDPADGVHQGLHPRRGVDQLGLLQRRAQLLDLGAQACLLACRQLRQLRPIERRRQLAGQGLQELEVRGVSGSAGTAISQAPGAPLGSGRGRSAPARAAAARRCSPALSSAARARAEAQRASACSEGIA